jgi:hypothetical protein
MLSKRQTTLLSNLFVVGVFLVIGYFVVKQLGPNNDLIAGGLLGAWGSMFYSLSVPKCSYPENLPPENSVIRGGILVISALAFFPFVRNLMIEQAEAFLILLIQLVQNWRGKTKTFSHNGIGIFAQTCPDLLTRSCIRANLIPS